MKKITIVCNNYPPELGAAASRLQAMAKLFAANGYNVQVITLLPNYPTGKIFQAYKGKITCKEMLDGIAVYRMPFYPSNKKSVMDRGLSMSSQLLSLSTLGLWKMLTAHADIILVNSPSMVNGFTGTLLAKLVTKAKLVLNVSDLYPLTALTLGAIKPGKGYNLLQWLERRMYKRADAIICQSDEIAAHIKEAIPNSSRKLLVYRNLKPLATENLLPKPLGNRTVVYAGLLGIAQGVLDICKAIPFAKLNLQLHIYGDGAEKEALLHYLNQNHDTGIYYHGTVPEQEVPDVLKAHHAILVPLKRHIPGAVPSKIFMAMANGLPVIYHGHGEAASIIAQQKMGLISASNDYEMLQQNFMQLATMPIAEYEAMRENSLASAKEFFNTGVQEKKLLHLFSELLQGQ